jgi:phosphomannomutase
VGREYWPVRLNVHVAPDVQARLVERLKGTFTEFVGRHVANENRLDGMKLIFDDGSWVLVRPSGTEPVVRIYAEAASVAAAGKLAEEARAWVGN